MVAGVETPSAPRAEHVAAPPIREPMGRMLFGEFSTRVRQSATHSTENSIASVDLRRRVHRWRRRLASE